jgi:tetratricopeptide (TPR) repeat protein
MYVQPRRRPELMLLASLLILVMTLVIRVVLDRARPPQEYALDVPAPVPAEITTEDAIKKMQDRLRSNPEDTAAYAQLGLLLLQRVRENADASLYNQAAAAFGQALQRDPQQIDALSGQGILALARHQFTAALAWGERAQAINPYRAQLYGIMGDANIELGRYDDAAATLQKMVDTRPDLSSYSRISYLRELHGDVSGAIEAMKQAVAAGNPMAEGTLWTEVQLGHLYFNSGDLPHAEESYRQALRTRPDYVYALGGIARVRAAQGYYDEAIGDYQEIVKRLPLPEFVIALGELYEVTGRETDAKLQYDLVRAIQQLNTSAGVDVDMELALFNVDHGADPAQALQQARVAYSHRPSIYGADVLGWTLYRNGDYAEARRYSQEALRLGTRDALLHFHAGMIAYALGDTDAARKDLQEALAINPAFSVRYAPQAREMLDKMSGGG